MTLAEQIAAWVRGGQPQQKPALEWGAPPAPLETSRAGRAAPVNNDRGALEYYLGGTGIPERLAAANQMFNPVEAIGGSMRASERMFDPETSGWGRVEAAGDMLSGVAGVVAPTIATAKLGGPAADALVDTLTGFGASAKDFGADESGALRLFHVAPDSYNGGDLLSLHQQMGEDAYEEFAKRWPESGDLGQAHADKIFMFDNIDEASSYRDWRGGKIVEIDPDMVDAKVDPFEGYKYADTRINRDAILSILQKYGLAPGMFSAAIYGQQDANGGQQ